MGAEPQTSCNQLNNKGGGVIMQQVNLRLGSTFVTIGGGTLNENVTGL
jgi:hypothetical protein